MKDESGKWKVESGEWKAEGVFFECGNFLCNRVSVLWKITFICENCLKKYSIYAIL